MAQPPAVVFIARHGIRLDAAAHSWHLSTPTPYDPPLTYSGWNQCQSLGLRVAAILHAREQAHEHGLDNHLGGTAFTRRTSSAKKKRRHKIVIHTSPFLRCVQTSVAIASGIAQFEPPKETRPATARPRTPGYLHTSSPRLRAIEGAASPSISPMPEPMLHVAQSYARKMLDDSKYHKRTKLRIDAWLGEWLNPQYFEDITPPPPSPMLLASAKGELMKSESVEVYTPSTSSKSSATGSLWSNGNGNANGSKSATRNPFDDWNHMSDALSDGRARTERSSSVSSVGSSASCNGRRSPFRPYGNALPVLPPPMRPEPAVYVPPTPTYAVSSSEQIPRGYVSHAREATVDVDYHWDSSRAPQLWGDGGEYGEEWSSMQKRFRRGLNHAMDWYSHHGVADRAEDALGLDQADHTIDDDEQEDLVVILVTHGAGSNALIGALTGQPVLLDVGMASLTMAVRKENAPTFQPQFSPVVQSPAVQSPNTTPHSPPELSYAAHTLPRRGSAPIGLHDIYDMKLVASSDHLRPGHDPTKLPSMMLANVSDQPPKHKRFRSAAQPSTHSHDSGIGAPSGRNRDEPAHSNTSTSLGSIRRPSTHRVPSRGGSGTARASLTRGHSYVVDEVHNAAAIAMSPGLWTPPAARTQPTHRFEEPRDSFFPPTDSRPAPLDGPLTPPADIPRSNSDTATWHPAKPTDSVITLHNGGDGWPSTSQSLSDSLGDLDQVADRLPMSLRRGLSQKGLWGHSPVATDRMVRTFIDGPKRRWTVTSEN